VLPSVNLGDFRILSKFPVFFGLMAFLAQKCGKSRQKNFDFKAQGKSVQNIAF